VVASDVHTRRLAYRLDDYFTSLEVVFRGSLRDEGRLSFTNGLAWILDKIIFSSADLRYSLIALNKRVKIDLSSSIRQHESTIVLAFLSRKLLLLSKLKIVFNYVEHLIAKSLRIWLVMLSGTLLVTKQIPACRRRKSFFEIMS